jgi:hypothetical protein
MEGAAMNAWPTLDLPEGAFSTEYATIEVKTAFGDMFPVRTLAGLEYAAYSFGFFSTINDELDQERLVNECIDRAVHYKWLQRAEAVAMFQRAWDSGREVAELEQSLAGTAPLKACAECTERS